MSGSIYGSLYGYVAEFDDPGKLVEAARAVRDSGYSKFEAYSPYPIRELEEIVPGWNPLAPVVLFGGLFGAACAWALQSYVAVFNFPINVGGRPLYSWPSFVPITFELTVLFAASAAFFGALWLCGFPRPHHPMFNLSEFARVTNDRFFLCIEARDRKFYPRDASEFLADLDPLEIWEVDQE